jgi:hypothetical protein
MDCAAIQELLSEYIDGTLDEKAVQVVDRHISVCEDCKETLASLSAIVEELNSLEPVEPPADFLKKIHQRMEPRLDLNRILRKLFVPFRVKIPLQLAAAATASILVVMVLNLQKSEYQKIQPLEAPKSERLAEKPKSDHLTPEFKTKTKAPAPALEEAPGRLSDSEQVVPAQRSSVKTLLQPPIQKESEPHPSVLAKAGPSAGKGQPMALALFLNPVDMSNVYAPDIANQTKPLSDNDKKIIEEEKTDKDTFGRKFEYQRGNQVDDLLFRINHIIRPLNGKILAKEYTKQKNRLKSIHVQMPAKNYASFCRELTSLGTFKTPPPALSDQGLETVNFLVNLIYPE